LFSRGFSELDTLLGGGYAEKSTVLVTGLLGVSKEILAYRFIQSGIHDIALIYAGLGENSKALDLLEECLAEKTIIRLVNFAVEPAFATLRSEPEVQSSFEKAKFRKMK
jgi:predicted ATP-dependent serine protease